MELPKLLLGAILLGITVETTSCTKDDKTKVTPTTNQQPTDGTGNNQQPGPGDCCPACGMG